MSRVTVGVCLPTDTLVPDEVRDSATTIERLGFDQVAVGEHVLAPRPTPSVFTTLSYAAAVTDTVGLLSAVALAPLYPPALLAKLAGSLDLLSGHRFVLGVGVGGEVPVEFTACGVPRRERGVRADDALTVVRALTRSDGPVSVTTSAWTVDEVELQPRAGPIPVWVAGRRERALVRAATFGDAWFPYLVTPDQVAAGRERLATLAPQVGRPVPAITVYCFLRVGDDRRAARSRAAEFVSGRYSVPIDRVDRYVVAGDAADCVAQLGRFRDAGATGFVLRLAGEPAEFDRMIADVAATVLPEVQRFGAPPVDPRPARAT